MEERYCDWDKRHISTTTISCEDRLLWKQLVFQLPPTDLPRRALSCDPLQLGYPSTSDEDLFDEDDESKEVNDDVAAEKGGGRENERGAGCSAGRAGGLGNAGGEDLAVLVKHTVEKNILY